MSEAAAAKTDHEPLIIGRYALFDALASGGMATVHLGRLLGSVGFGRTVAVKRLHSHYTNDQDFVTMFMDEARIVARIRHPNVVPMVDVIESSKGLFLIMEYVHGESLSKLIRTSRATKELIPIKLVNAVLHGVLLGLHAAHETKGANGELLGVVHRDVSPQNIIVGADGVARVLDFGVAKAAGRAQVTREGQIKGKLAYMAPEQIRGKVDRRADVYAAAVVLWEALAGRRLHEGAKDVEIVSRVVHGKFPPPSEHRAEVPPELDEIVMRGLEMDPEKRYPNAREMAIDIERKFGLATPSEIGEWVERLAPEALRSRAEKVAAMEAAAGDLLPSDSVPPPSDEDEESPSAEDAEAAAESDKASAIVDKQRAQLASEPGPQELTTVMEGAPPLPPGEGRSSSPPSKSSLTELSSPGVSSSSGVSSPGISSSGIKKTRSSSGGTPVGTEVPAVAPENRKSPLFPRDLAPVIALVSFCVALAIVGAVLGIVSISARRGPASPSPSLSSSSTTTPMVSQRPTPPSVPTTDTTPSPRPTTGTNATSAPRPTTAAQTNTSSDAGATANANNNNNTTPQHAWRPSTPAPTVSTKKTNCDPPYTVDEAGHRHYKLECMSE